MRLYHQFLPQEVRPLKPEMKLVGFAMPVLMIDVYGEQDKPFGYLTEALEKARGEKVVRQAIENGMTATDAFAKFRIL